MDSWLPAEGKPSPLSPCTTSSVHVDGLSCPGGHTTGATHEVMRGATDDLIPVKDNELDSPSRGGFALLVRGSGSGETEASYGLSPDTWDILTVGFWAARPCMYVCTCFPGHPLS